ncbi:MAG: hypothetical protein ACOX4U_00600 [Anaerovoracaceae bacterium]|jgi:hypothetical protein
MIVLTCSHCGSKKIEFARTDFKGEEEFMCEDCGRATRLSKCGWEEV